MKLRNRSRRDSFVLSELCSFVFDHYQHAAKVFLEVVDQEPGEESGGLANKFNGSEGCPARVTIWLTQDRKFPTYNSFEGFRTRLFSWEEEFVLVLAHELRHIDQFYTSLPKDYEYDAERYGIGVLRAFRAQIQRAA